MKFRIIKKTEQNVFNGKKREFFVVQKLYLWLFWYEYDAGFCTHRYDYLDLAQNELKQLNNIHGWKILSKEVVE